MKWRKALENDLGELKVKRVKRETSNRKYLESIKKEVKILKDNKEKE